MFTVDEVFKMIDAGVIHPDERFELIEGEIFPMSPEKMRHLRLRSDITSHLNRTLDRQWLVVPDGTLRLSETTFLEPDVYVLDRKDAVDGPIGGSVLLCIEVADTTLRFDLDDKPYTYAQYGIPELWVVDAARQITHVYREPSAAGYGSVAQVVASETLTALRVPGLALRLDAL